MTGGLPEDTPSLPEIPEVQGHHLYGGPQMLQLRSDRPMARALGSHDSHHVLG